MAQAEADKELISGPSCHEVKRKQAVSRYKKRSATPYPLKIAKGFN